MVFQYSDDQRMFFIGKPSRNEIDEPASLETPMAMGPDRKKPASTGETGVVKSIDLNKQSR